MKICCLNDKIAGLIMTYGQTGSDKAYTMLADAGVINQTKTHLLSLNQIPTAWVFELQFKGNDGKDQGSSESGQ